MRTYAKVKGAIAKGKYGCPTYLEKIKVYILTNDTEERTEEDGRM